MHIVIENPRRDGKTPVRFSFNNGVIIRALIPNKEYESVPAMLAKHPEATTTGLYLTRANGPRR